MTAEGKKGAGPSPPASDRRSYSVWAFDKLRYSDTDRQGHVNNAVFATFCETGRVSFLYDEKLRLAAPGSEFVVVHLSLDYLAELHYPGEVEIGTRVLAIGNTSFTFRQGIFRGEECVATADTVIVQLDSRSRRPAPLTPAMRAWLGERMG